MYEYFAILIFYRYLTGKVKFSTIHAILTIMDPRRMEIPNHIVSPGYIITLDIYCVDSLSDKSSPVEEV